MNEEKEKALRMLQKTMNKKHKENILFIGKSDSNITDVDIIPSSSLGINLATRIGGWPKQRIVEIYGPESSGKTTIALDAIANEQKQGGIAAFVDAEHALDLKYAEALGVDTEKLLISQPSTGEQGLEVVDTLVKSGIPGIIVIDSVAALIPQRELEGEMGDSHMGLHARLMSQACRKLTALVSQTNTCLMFINQIRHKIGVMFGSPETVTGGNALKFYSSMRVEIRRTGGDKKTKNTTRVKIVKNKLGVPFGQAEFDLVYGQGIDIIGEIVDLATTYDIIHQRGAWYTYGEIKTQGKDAMKELLCSDQTVIDNITTKILELASGE
tara:strand:+ start:1226 stop:2203 length:978 start_codon:yes stop_codon:yes gene_type:complete